jgi:hypothetical protein
MLAGFTTLALYFAFIPLPPPSKWLRIDSVVPAEPSTQVYMHALSAAYDPSSRTVQNRSGHGQRIASPSSYILASARVRGGSESTLRVPRRVCAEYDIRLLCSTSYSTICKCIANKDLPCCDVSPMELGCGNAYRIAYGSSAMNLVRIQRNMQGALDILGSFGSALRAAEKIERLLGCT